MNNWKKLDSGILVPKDKPLSDKERRKIARDKYYAQHACCPKCKSDGLEMTTMGSIDFDPDRYSDCNYVWCSCNWNGKVDDLVPREA